MRLIESEEIELKRSTGELETVVWMAESPTHLIHFNGERFLGPYEEEG